MSDVVFPLDVDEKVKIPMGSLIKYVIITNGSTQRKWQLVQRGDGVLNIRYMNRPERPRIVNPLISPLEYRDDEMGDGLPIEDIRVDNKE